MLAAFGELVGTEPEDVEVLSVKKWDPKGEYEDVVEAVKKAVGGGEVQVYRVSGGGVTVVYFVVGVEKGGMVVKGVKVKSVES